MVTEQNEFVGFDVVAVIGILHSRCFAVGVEVENLLGDVKAVEAVTDRKDAERRENHRDGIDALKPLHDVFPFRGVFNDRSRYFLRYRGRRNCSVVRGK